MTVTELAEQPTEDAAIGGNSAGDPSTSTGVEAIESAGGPVDSHTIGRRPALSTMGIVAVLALSLDVVTKQLAVAHLTESSPVTVIRGVLYLVLTRNSGAAFSMGTGYTFVFPVITLVVVGWIAWMAIKLRSVPWAVSLGLVLGGAFGNLVDRIFRAPGPFLGHVVDFLSVFNDAGRAFPIFNAADSALVCGVVLAVVLELTGRRRDGSRVRH
jgi:signal peptidase II